MPIPDEVELQTPQTKEWPLIPADVYQAEITDIEYKTEPNRYKQEATDPDTKPIMKLEFTIIEEGPHYGRKLWQRMAPIKPLPPKQNGKASWVWRIASALAGHALTHDEGEKYTTSDINGFIHRQIRMTVTESEPKANGKQYNNIDGFLAAKQLLAIFDPKKVQPTQPVAAVSQQEPQTGYEKAKAVANSLPGASVPPESEIEPTAPVSESDSTINVEDIPF
jgi:hypothetical protein